MLIHRHWYHMSENIDREAFVRHNVLGLRCTNFENRQSILRNIA